MESIFAGDYITDFGEKVLKFTLVDQSFSFKYKVGLKNIEGKVSINGAPFIKLTNVLIEESPGHYAVPLTPAEVDGDYLVYSLAAPNVTPTIIVVKRVKVSEPISIVAGRRE